MVVGENNRYKRQIKNKFTNGIFLLEQKQC